MNIDEEVDKIISEKCGELKARYLSLSKDEIYKITNEEIEEGGKIVYTIKMSIEMELIGQELKLLNSDGFRNDIIQRRMKERDEKINELLK